MIFINLYYIFGYVVIIVFNSIIFIHFLVLLEPYFVNFLYKARFCFVVSFYCLFCSLNFWALLFIFLHLLYRLFSSFLSSSVDFECSVLQKVLFSFQKSCHTLFPICTTSGATESSQSSVTGIYP